MLAVTRLRMAGTLMREAGMGKRIPGDVEVVVLVVVVFEDEEEGEPKRVSVHLKCSLESFLYTAMFLNSIAESYQNPKPKTKTKKKKKKK
jgi:hypothetical protein